MKYKIFTTDSIEVLQNEECIGEADTYQAACNIIKEQIPRANSNPHWRVLMGDIATFIDYGSWSKFVAIVPPISMKELSGDGEIATEDIE